MIAIVDAFSYPTAGSELQTFSAAFGLTPCSQSTPPQASDCLQAKNLATQTNCDWAGETALDLEWVHAIAPDARIVLVSAKSDAWDDMMAAVDEASTLVQQLGGGEVSLSWGASEFPDETSLESHFQKPGVVFLASSGDVGGVVTYPSSSPNVVSVGGTHLRLDENRMFEEQTTWVQAGAGQSVYFATPAFQSSVGVAKRSTPNVVANADPYSVVAVFNTSQCSNLPKWQIVGGTCLASPLVAAMANRAKHFLESSAEELKPAYGGMAISGHFRDITEGSAGSYKAGPGFDLATGIDAPLDGEFDLGNAH